MKTHRDMFQYVKNCLGENYNSSGPNKMKIRYERYDHILRVYQWMIRITDELKDDNLDLESLKIATIFHDCGYGLDSETVSHAEMSARLCQDYLNRRDYPPAQIEFICDLVARHSDKRLMHEPNTPIELVVLMEADMLDDTGAMGIILDAWIESKEDNATFDTFAKHIQKYTYSHMKNVEMVTAPGKRFWHEKRMLVYDFLRQYKRDLGEES